jgi:hypothetical protein
MDIIDTVLETKKLEDLTNDKDSVYVEPELTEEKVNKAIDYLKDVESSGGIIKIAMVCDLTVDQVTLIQQKMNEKINNLKAEALAQEVEKV